MRLNNEEFNVLTKGEDIVQLLKGIIRLKYNTITVFLKKNKNNIKKWKRYCTLYERFWSFTRLYRNQYCLIRWSLLKGRI